MGCDIHLAVEVRLPSSGWTYVPRAGDGTAWFTGRSYTLFGVLAGVRGSDDPIAEPRGWPADASDDARTATYHPCSHSASWLTLAELDAYDWHRDDPDDHALLEWFVTHTLPALRALARAEAIPPSDVRLVFAFDS